ncbi:MAG: FAD-binding oxidoreductase [Candidatus Krumholzibacteriota bacterium]|nr:FAD-binding oxidoreductase [Candidatus Krumholzibacteriota bacterium]
MKKYDAIIIGAGSVGCPLSYFLSLEGWKVLVLDGGRSPGQGQNKAAIGGVRATHSDPAKIKLCLKSLEIFSTWEERHGTDIGWIEGGYCFPVYRKKDEEALKQLLPVQKDFGLDIDWVDPSGISSLVPGINNDGLLGGTYSPGDGQVSPLKAAAAFWKESRDRGTEFLFGEPVISLLIRSGRIEGVETSKGKYYSDVVVNAAGAYAKEIGMMAGLEIPVVPESHEAGISAPMERFFDPLVVDIRPGTEKRTANFYFGQNDRGQVIFCYTPIDPIEGTNLSATSEFMPVIARRLIDLIPRLKNMLVRRVWRGLYPMTPDGIIILDSVREVTGMYLCAGMCGQGFMLGPGVGLNMARFIITGKPQIEEEIFASVGFYRDYHAANGETLK